MSHSFHTYLQHFFTRLPIRIGRSKLREQIDISLFLLKTDILQVKLRKTVCVPVQQRHL